MPDPAALELSTKAKSPVVGPAPLVRGLPLIGVALRMRQDPLGTMRAAAGELGDVFRMKLGPYTATLFRNPEQIRHIFVDNAANFSKQTRGYEKSRLVLGDGLVTSEGELWQRQRRIANPAFHRQRVAGFATTMTVAADAMLRGWPEKTRDGRPIDVFTEMMRVTLGIAVSTLLGTGVGEDTAELQRAVSLVLERTNDIITNPASLPIWVPTWKNVTFRRAIRRLDDFVYATIAKRRAAPDGEATDLLSMLMQSRDEQTGEGMSDRLLRDEAVTTLIAGHETVANVLTWALYLVGTHADVRERLAAEARDVLGGRTPTMDDVPRLKFTRTVVDEAMRLYPPAWMIGRAAVTDDVIGGYRVDAGKFVLVSPYMTHRHPGLWDDPDAFDPDRFAEGGAAGKQPKFAYLPFGGGQRFCIGSTFALVEATLILSMIAGRVTLAPVPDHPVVPYAMITLRPKHGVRMTAKWHARTASG